MERKNIHIEDSYSVWSTGLMQSLIIVKARERYGKTNPVLLLGRSYGSMYREWWAHNIGYYVTKPFCRFKKIAAINERCKHVDLEEWK